MDVVGGPKMERATMSTAGANSFSPVYNSSVKSSNVNILLTVKVVLWRGADLSLRLLPTGVLQQMPAVESWKVVVLTLFQKISISLISGNTWRSWRRRISGSASTVIPPLLESSARTIGQSLDFTRYQHFQELMTFSFALSTFSCQEKLSAKIGKLPAASPSTPATPKKNSKVCFCREKICRSSDAKILH